MLIFDEKRYAEDLLEHGFKRMMSIRDLSILAKYFKYLGKNTRQIRQDLEEYCQKFNPSFNLVISSNTIEYALKICKKYSLRISSPIFITQKELALIRDIDDYKISKIFFTMVTIAKYFSQNRTSISSLDNKVKKIYISNFYVNERFTGILKNAHVYVSCEERYRIMKQLHDLGLIEATYTGAYRIFGIENGLESGSAILIEDMNNLHKYYPIYCASCGKMMDYKPKRRNICDECYFKLRKENIRDNVRKYRKCLM